MNYRDSNTRNFNMNSRLTRAERVRRRRRRQAVLLIILALLVVVLIVSIVIIVKEVAAAGAETTLPAGSDSPVTTAGVIDTGHPAEYAYDGNNDTYMLIPSSQTVGSWFRLTLEAQTSVTSVGVVSNHDDYYIRNASVSVSTDGEHWTELGTFTGSAGNSGSMTVTPETAAEAKYVRIMLLSEAGVPWIINEIRVNSASGQPSGVTGAEAGAIPAETAEQTTSAPETTAVQSGYTSVLKNSSDFRKGDLILVNSQYSYVFPESDASIMSIYENRNKLGISASGKTIYSYFPGNVADVSLGAVALTHLNSMCDAFYNLTGNQDIYIPTNGGYRSYERQQELLNKATDKSKVAAPGSSEHHTGLSVDLQVWVYEDSKSYFYDLDGKHTSCQTILPWITANAYKYGFIRRYPPDKSTITGISYSSWLYRYVGYVHAYYMTQNNLSLEEYLAYVAQFPYTGNHLAIAADDGHNYEVYFVPVSTGGVTTVPVPTSNEYTISGNNYSGFIVTVTKN